MIAFSIWNEKSFIKFSLLVFIATLFHKSAVVMFFFGLFINNRYLLLKFFLGLPILAAFSLFLVLVGSLQNQFTVYILDKSYQSSGGLIRVIMNLVPTFILFYFRRAFKEFEDYRMLSLMGIATCISLITVVEFSTATDRFALYLTPLQIAVFSRLPILIKDAYWRTLAICVILLYHSAILGVWLNFANNSLYWVPYKSIVSQW